MHATSSLVETPFGWPIVVYLSLAALAAGSALVGCWRLARGARVDGRRSLLLALSTIVIGMLALIADLEAPSRLLAILRHFNPESMIAWGARAISLFAVLAGFIWWSTGRDGERTEVLTPSARERIGLLVLGALAVFVGVYPALVLAQATARPLWSSPVLVPLFLVSALHAGIAAGLLTRGRGGGRNGEPALASRSVEMILIVAQAILLAVFLFGIGDAMSDARGRLLTGSLAPFLWLGVVLIGWIVPFLLADGGNGRDQGRATWRAIAILVGVLALRALIVLGGQRHQALHVVGLS